MLADTFVCPDCKNTLNLKEKKLECPACHRIFSKKEGVLNLLPCILEETKLNEIELYLCKSKFESSAHQTIRANPRSVKLFIPHEILRFQKLVSRKYNLSGRVLELGAGVGWASILLKKEHKLMMNYVTDVSEDVLRTGRKLSLIEGTPIHLFVACDAENLPFPDSYFDYVFSWALIHHLPNPIRAFSEVNRVLKKSGKFLVGGEASIPLLFQRILESHLRKIVGKGEIFEYAHRRAKTYGILERVYTINDWEKMIHYSGFSMHDFLIDKTWVRNMSYRRLFYNTVVGLVPKKMTLKHFAGSIFIEIRK